MLSQKVFKEGLKKLDIEYGDRGFVISKQKADQWYSYLKNLSDSEFNKRIDLCILNCNHVPYMADLFKSVESVSTNTKEFDFGGL